MQAFLTSNESKTDIKFEYKRELDLIKATMGAHFLKFKDATKNLDIYINDFAQSIQRGESDSYQRIVSDCMDFL